MKTSYEGTKGSPQFWPKWGMPKLLLLLFWLLLLFFGGVGSVSKDRSREIAAAEDTKIPENVGDGDNRAGIPIENFLGNPKAVHSPKSYSRTECRCIIKGLRV